MTLLGMLIERESLQHGHAAGLAAVEITPVVTRTGRGGGES